MRHRKFICHKIHGIIREHAGHKNQIIVRDTAFPQSHETDARRKHKNKTDGKYPRKKKYTADENHGPTAIYRLALGLTSEKGQRGKEGRETKRQT